MAFIDDIMGMGSNTSVGALPTSPGGPLGGTPYPGGERPGTYGVDPGALDFSARPRAPLPRDGRTNWKPPGGFGGGGGAGTPTDDGASAPPPGFTAEQWAKLLKMAKKNPKIRDLIARYTASNSEEAKWRRVMPTDTSQLLKQLSYNAGEMGMPGGYVGAIQLPAYGETQPPVNNPDMSKYGQAKGLGEATFYQQSMNGGMAPIAAMSPLGVPEGWNPGGASGSLEKELKDYLDKIGKGGGGGGNGGGKMSTQQQFQADFEAFVKAGLGGGNNGRVFAAFPGGFRGGTRVAGGGGGKDGRGNDLPPAKKPGGTGTKPGVGIPISLPFGF